MTHSPMHERQPPRHDRARTSWQRTGLVMLAAFSLWFVLDATVLQHNANVISAPGTRRTVALDFLNPIADIARALRLDVPVGQANIALGRTPEGGFVIPTVPSTTAPPGTTTTTAPPLRPTPTHRLHVLIVGDSIGEDLAYPLLADLTATGVVAVNTDTVIDTGLTNLDYFNWIRELKYDIYRDHPQVIIGMMGANDNHAFIGPPAISFGTPPWRAQYLRNVAAMFSNGTKDGRKMLWVSVPIIQDKGQSGELQVIRDLQHKAAVQWRVAFFNSDSVLSPHGSYAAYLRVGGQLAQVRTPDGIHLTTAGGALLARSVIAALQADLHIRLG